MKKFTPKISKAINIAGSHHDGQERKGDGLPYIIHPFAVALILMDYSEDEDVIVASLLHDTVEDTEYTEAEMIEDFGPRISKLVMSVTETNKDDPWQKRKDDYLAHLKTAQYEAKLLCAADKLHNLQAMIGAYEKFGMEAEKAFNAPLEKKIWFYEECTKIIETDKKIPKKFIKELRENLSELKKKIPTQKTTNEFSELFAALVMDKSDYNFYVYIVNNSSIEFTSVKLFTGGFASDDDNLIETSKIVKNKGELKPQSVLQIDKSDWDELDFVIWYHIDLGDTKGNLYKYWFQLPKYGLGYEEKIKTIPILNQEGMTIELQERDGEMIDEEIKTINMQSVYHEFPGKKD